MKVLVTGATGFIGRHCVAQLADQGIDVVAVARNIPLPSRRPGLRSIAVDLFDRSAMRRVLTEERPTHLLHLAWNVEPPQYWRAFDNLEWVAESLALQRDFVDTGGRRVVIAGTAAEYDWRSDAVLDEGSTPLNPATLYGAAKDALHRVSAAASAAHGYQLAWGRVFWLYGPGERPGRLVSDVARALARGQPVACSAGLQRRDFLHVVDVARAFVKTLTSEWTGSFNIGSGTGVAIRDIVQTLADAAGTTELVQLGALPADPTEPPELVAGCDILGKHIGFRPSITLERGLAETLDWWRRN